MKHKGSIRYSIVSKTLAALVSIAEIKVKADLYYLPCLPNASASYIIALYYIILNFIVLCVEILYMVANPIILCHIVL